MSTLPTEIIEEILSFLPPKSLCRFKSVAKSWHFLITSDAFIKLHLSKTLIFQPPNLILSDVSLSTAVISAANPNYLSFSDVYQPLSSAFDFIGSCRGIVCIDSQYDTAFVNPITKTHRLIPSSHSSSDHVVALGFGYDSSVDDYKLLKISYCYDLMINSEDIDRIYDRIELYSMRSNSWKIVNDDFGDYHIQQPNVVHVNGVLYFDVYHELPLVKCFDLKTEEFSSFEMFKIDKSFENYFFVVVELGGCFAVMVNYMDEGFENLLCFELWVRKEVSWVRVFRVSDLPKTGRFAHIRPLVYSKDGGRVLLELDGSEFCWFDWRSNLVTRVKACGLPRKKSCFATYTFVPSIVSLRSDEDKANDERKGKENDVPKKNVNKKPSTVFSQLGSS